MIQHSAADSAVPIRS